MNLMNVFGALVKPNGMANHFYRPLLVLNRFSLITFFFFLLDGIDSLNPTLEDNGTTSSSSMSLILDVMHILDGYVFNGLKIHAHSSSAIFLWYQ